MSLNRIERKLTLIMLLLTELIIYKKTNLVVLYFITILPSLLICIRSNRLHYRIFPTINYILITNLTETGYQYQIMCHLF